MEMHVEDVMGEGVRVKGKYFEKVAKIEELMGEVS